jgi:hypothetical protein
VCAQAQVESLRAENEAQHANVAEASAGHAVARKQARRAQASADGLRADLGALQARMEAAQQAFTAEKAQAVAEASEARARRAGERLEEGEGALMAAEEGAARALLAREGAWEGARLLREAADQTAQVQQRLESEGRRRRAAEAAAELSRSEVLKQHLALEAARALVCV